MDALKRIISSRKVQTGIAGIIGAIIAVFVDADYTSELLSLITITTSLLVGGQVALDHKFGSVSDGTTTSTPE